MSSPLDEWRKRGGRALVDAVSAIKEGLTPLLPTPEAPVTQPCAQVVRQELVQRGGPPGTDPVYCTIDTPYECRSCGAPRCRDHLCDGCLPDCTDEHPHNAGQCNACFINAMPAYALAGKSWSDTLREVTRAVFKL